MPNVALIRFFFNFIDEKRFKKYNFSISTYFATVIIP